MTFSDSCSGISSSREWRWLGVSQQPCRSCLLPYQDVCQSVDIDAGCGRRRRQQQRRRQRQDGSSGSGDCVVDVVCLGDGRRRTVVHETPRNRNHEQDCRDVRADHHGGGARHPRGQAQVWYRDLHRNGAKLQGRQAERSRHRSGSDQVSQAGGKENYEGKNFYIFKILTTPEPLFGDI